MNQVKYGLWLAAAVLVLTIGSGMVQAAGVVYVDMDIAGSGDGTSWAEAKKTIIEGVAALADGDSLWIAEGTNTESVQVTISKPNVGLYGGFDGTETAFGQRDIDAHVVTVDGENARRCFNVTATNVTLDGLTIYRGRVGGTGAGINNTGADLTVRNCIVSACATTGDNRGGGIGSTKPMRVLDSVLANNTASSSANGAGGGIYFTSTGTLLVSNTVFRANTAREGNSGTSWHGCGGAIHMYNAGTLKAYNCVFDSNDAGNSFDGGAIYWRVSGGAGTFVNCTFYGNYTPRYGGAIYAPNGVPLSVHNSIFWGNTSGNAAGKQIYTGNGALTISYGCFPSLTSTDIRKTGTFNNNDVITSNPLFVNAAGHDFHLQSRGGHWTAGDVFVIDAANSPCIDVGDPSSAYGAETFFNGGRINLGAYGNTVQAARSEQAPRVQTDPATHVVGETTAVLNGTLTYMGIEQPEVWVYWGANDGSNNAAAWAHTNSLGVNAAAIPAALATNVSVELGTTVYYRYRAGNASGTNWAPESVLFVVYGLPVDVEITASDPDADETTADSGAFMVTRENRGLEVPLTIDFAVSGSATEGSDYPNIGTSVTIPSGATNAPIAIVPTYDFVLDEGPETVTLTLLTNPAYAIQAPGAATVTIADNPTAGTIIYVDRDVVGGAGNGTSWANASATIRGAPAYVRDGSEVWVAEGTYLPTSPILVNESNVTIYGGFAGDETERTQRDITNHVVIVDGQDARRCFTITAQNTTMDGVTITRGRASSGGGINNSGNGLILQHCIVSNCVVNAVSAGAGIYSSASMQLLDSQVVDCRNLVDFNDNGIGSGIYFSSAGTLVVSNSVFRNNLSIEDNSSTPEHGSGGAIHMVAAGTLLAYNCVFDSNEAQDNRDGGAIYWRVSGGAGMIENCTFYGNHATSEGGAIYAVNGVSLDVRNNIFWGNTGAAASGKQIYTGNGALTLSYGSFPSLTTTDIRYTGTLSTNGLITGDPLFVDALGSDFHLQSRGGHWTATGFVNDSEDSLCIDAGNPDSSYNREPDFNGRRINLGAYGNTEQASKRAKPSGILLLVR